MKGIVCFVTTLLVNCALSVRAVKAFYRHTLFYQQAATEIKKNTDTHRRQTY